MEALLTLYQTTTGSLTGSTSDSMNLNQCLIKCGETIDAMFSHVVELHVATRKTRRATSRCEARVHLRWQGSIPSRERSYFELTWGRKGASKKKSDHQHGLHFIFSSQSSPPWKQHKKLVCFCAASCRLPIQQREQRPPVGCRYGRGSSPAGWLALADE